MNNSKVWQPSDIQGASSEPDGDAPRRRGRIPQTAWPRILELHRNGTTLTAIAKEFDCTPSAISYILKKAEAAGMDTSDAPETETAPDAAVAPAPAPAPVPAPAKAAAQAEAETPPPRPATTGQLSLPTAPRPPAPAAPEARVPGTRLTGQIGLKNMTPSTPVPPTPPPPPPPPPAPAAAAPAGEKAAPAAAGGAGGRSEPAPVDATEGRLRETARAALVAYRSWRQTPGEKSIQTLGDAVHELRRVLARIEIDMSASRRDEQAARPIPIPWHRAARRNTPQGGTEG